MVKDMLAAADDDILVVDSDSDLSHEPIQVGGGSKGWVDEWDR